jgi:hypothetical protein
MSLFEGKEKRIGHIFKEKTGKLDPYTKLEDKLERSAKKDPYLLNHSNRVMETARSICMDLKLSNEKTVSTIVGAKLHDIGLADYYNMKQSIMTMREEYKNEAYKNHCEKGAKLVEALKKEFPEIDKIVLYHHEHYDGTGEKGIQSFEIPFESSIISVADCFDKLMYDENGRTETKIEEAVFQIEAKTKTQFDPAVAEAMTKIRWTSEQNTISGLRTGNFNYRQRLGDYLKEAKEYIKECPFCEQSQLEQYLRKKRRLSENNASLIASFSMNKYSNKKLEMPMTQTLTKENIFSTTKEEKNKLEITFTNYYNDIQPGDFVIYKNKLWNTLMLGDKFICLGK